MPPETSAPPPATSALPHSVSPTPTALENAEHGLAGDPVSALAAATQRRASDARRPLCDDLLGAGGAGLLRSWFVMVCFSLGLGAAAPLEEEYRPLRYDRSRTRRNDWVLTTLTLALMVSAVVLTRLHTGEQGHAPLPLGAGQEPAGGQKNG